MTDRGWKNPGPKFCTHFVTLAAVLTLLSVACFNAKTWDSQSGVARLPDPRHVRMLEYDVKGDPNPNPVKCPGGDMRVLTLIDRDDNLYISFNSVVASGPMRELLMKTGSGANDAFVWIGQVDPTNNYFFAVESTLTMKQYNAKYPDRLNDICRLLGLGTQPGP